MSAEHEASKYHMGSRVYDAFLFTSQCYTDAMLDVATELGGDSFRDQVAKNIEPTSKHIPGLPNPAAIGLVSSQFPGAENCIRDDRFPEYCQDREQRERNETDNHMAREKRLAKMLRKSGVTGIIKFAHAAEVSRTHRPKTALNTEAYQANADVDANQGFNP